MNYNDKHLVYDFEFSHIVKEIKIPVTIYASRNSTEGKSITIDAIWDTGATNSVIAPNIFEELALDSIDKSIMSGISYKNKEADVVIATIVLPNGKIINNKRFSVNEIPGTEILIGMDIISMGDFVITNAKGKTMFSFVIPTLNNKISLSDMVNN
ncbi:MAG: retroviral-like aspartic protease family protein [Treponema sp.]|nr:retroviral-like aspartic protease family protein [Treponema sp.]